MTKIRLVATMVFVATASSQAFATKARLRALNQSTSGSYYIIDSRNIFLNPAQIGLHKEHVNLEWGQQERDGVNDQNTEAEGGFVLDLGQGKLGLQLGRVTSFNQKIRVFNAVMEDLGTNAVGGTFAEGQNNIDIVYGTTGATKVGGGLALTRSKQATGTPDQESEVQALEVKGGVYNDAFEFYGSLLMGAKTETEMGTDSGELEQQYGFEGGAGYQLAEDKRLYGSVTYDSFEVNRGNAVKYDGTGFGALAGFMNSRAIKNGRFFYSFELMWLNYEADDDVGDTDEKFSMFSAPVTLGLESEAKEWLRIRGSVRQNVLLGSRKQTDNGATNNSHSWENAPNNTAVAVGAGLSLDQFMFDVTMVQALESDHGRAEASLNYVF